MCPSLLILTMAQILSSCNLVSSGGLRCLDDDDDEDSGMMILLAGVWDLAELHSSPQALRLLTWERILWVVTGQCLLVKHSCIATEETPLGSLNHRTFIVFDWKTNMKHLSTNQV